MVIKKEQDFIHTGKTIVMPVYNKTTNAHLIQSHSLAMKMESEGIPYIVIPGVKYINKN